MDNNGAFLFNRPYNGAVMAKAGVGYAMMLDRLVQTDEKSGLVFRPLLDVPKAEMYIIWRKYQTFTPVSELLVKTLREKFSEFNT